MLLRVVCCNPSRALAMRRNPLSSTISIRNRSAQERRQCSEQGHSMDDPAEEYCLVKATEECRWSPPAFLGCLYQTIFLRRIIHRVTLFTALSPLLGAPVSYRYG